MHPIVYDVAVSLDGFISGPSGDVSKFAHEGPVVSDYHARLAEYTISIMGRATYEFGYAFGLVKGQNPYPHTETIVYTQTIDDTKNADVEFRRTLTVDNVMALKSKATGPIYLCGGGQLAGWMLTHGLIDRLILKRAPVVYGSGTSLFGGCTADSPFRLLSSRSYDNGYLLEEYER